MSIIGGPRNDDDNGGYILTCEQCGLGAFHLRAIGADMSRMFVCATCYDRDALADVPTVELPAVTPAKTVMAEPPIEPVADAWSGCTPEPGPGQWCAAGYLAYLETTGMSFIPIGDATLCPAHRLALLDLALAQYPQLRMKPQDVPLFADILADMHITASITIADRIAMRQGR